MKKVILCILLLLSSNILAGQIGIYPAIGTGFLFGKTPESYDEEPTKLKFYVQGKINLVSFQDEKGTYIRLLGGGINYTKNGGKFYTISPFSFKGKNGWEIGFDLVYKSKQVSKDNTVGMTLGWWF